MSLSRFFSLVAGIVAGVALISSISAHAHEISDAEAAAALSAFAANLEKSSIVGEPDIVDCTLSGGTKTKCFRVTMTPTPVRYTPGPWCPGNIADGPDKSGIWLDKGKVYDADGPFIKNLPNFYNDPRWQLYDPATGKVNVTDTKASCAGAARPDVDPKFRNHCVQCLTSYLDPQPALTFVIPARPVKAKKTTAALSIHWRGARLQRCALRCAGAGKGYSGRPYASTLRRLRWAREPARGISLSRGDRLHEGGAPAGRTCAAHRGGHGRFRNSHPVECRRLGTKRT